MIFRRSKRAKIPGTDIEFPPARGVSLFDKVRLLTALQQLWTALETRMKKSSWKTTLGGLLTAAGQALMAATDSTLHIVGQVLTILGPILLGLAARDNNVSSEAAGVK